MMKIDTNGTTGAPAITFENNELGDYSYISNIVAQWIEQWLEYRKTHPMAGVPSGYINRSGDANMHEHPDDDELEEFNKEFVADVEKLLYALRDENPNDGIEDFDAWLAEEHKHREKVDEGLALFPKVWQSLWI